MYSSSTHSVTGFTRLSISVRYKCIDLCRFMLTIKVSKNLVPQNRADPIKIVTLSTEKHKNTFSENSILKCLKN